MERVPVANAVNLNLVLGHGTALDLVRWNGVKLLKRRSLESVVIAVRADGVADNTI